MTNLGYDPGGAVLEPTRNRLIAIADVKKNAVGAVTTAFRYRITAVQAPAGWGKTTAVRAALDHAPHTWCELRTAPMESGRLFFALATAFGVPRTLLALPLREARQTGSPQGLVDFLGVHAGFEVPIVVDDLHALSADALSLETLVGLIDANPASRWILISRQQLPLPYSRWIASGDCGVPVSQADLALDAADVLDTNKIAAKNPYVIRRLVEVTGGWAVAIRFGLAALERSGDLPRLSATTRETLFAYLANEVLGAVSEEQRELLSDLAFAGPVDEMLLSELGRVDPAADLRWLSGSPVPLMRNSSESVSLHDLLAEFLRSEQPKDSRQQRACRVAQALRRRGLLDRAFDLLALEAPHTLSDVFQAHGLDLLDQGRRESVERALRNVPQRAYRSDPALLLLRAELAKDRSYEQASQLFEHALQVATHPRLRVTLALRYAHYRCVQRKDPAQTLEVLAPALDDAFGADKASVHSTRAVALVDLSRIPESLAEMHRALELARSLDDDWLLSRTLSRATYVAYYAGERVEAVRLAEEGAELAERIGDWSAFQSAHMALSARAASLGDADAELRHTELMLFGAERAGSGMQRARAALFLWSCYIERGDRLRADALGIERFSNPVCSDEAYCVVMSAVRSGWDGNFLEALARLETYDPSGAERWLVDAARALFFALTEAADDAERLLSRRSAETMNNPSRTERADLADCIAAFTDVLLGNVAAALRRLPKGDRHPQNAALRCFVQDLASLGSGFDAAAAAPSLERLREAKQEGFAMLFESAFRSRRRGLESSALTRAEQKILVLLSTGHSAKAIALQLGKSVHTVRNQIKSVAHKLGASGKWEAVAIAGRRGLLGSRAQSIETRPDAKS
ncbi:MAG: hypothetical protein JOZ38_05390 [Candidatus Eremiobacteraeota bacterium]|nr:hypothetical protein [Candidatus Eremiobacteraeota bacterium]